MTIKRNSIIMGMRRVYEYNYDKTSNYFSIVKSACRSGGEECVLSYITHRIATRSAGIFVLGNSQRRGLPSPRPHNNFIASKLRVRSVSYFGRSEQMKWFSSVVSNDRTRRKGIHPSASHRQKMTEGLDPSVAPVTKPLTLLSCLGG